MNFAENFFSMRLEYLLAQKNQIESQLENAPAGTLRIKHDATRIQYFQRSTPQDSLGKYIKRKDLPIAHALAQKDYDQKVLLAINQEIHAIERYCALFPKKRAEDIYETMRKDRQDLIVPIQETDQQYIRSWSSVSYQGKPFDASLPKLYTSREERVRSKSEIIIADTLSRESIPYRYECPLHIPDVGNIYPDFTVLNAAKRKELYWEHFGMMDDSQYVEKVLLKIRTYELNGIYPGDNLILTYETHQTPIDQKQVLLNIKHYLQ